MRISFLISFFLLSVAGYSQKHYEYVQGKDTLKLPIIEAPTVCDCENFDYRNREQQRICEKLYDTGMMSADELKKYRVMCKFMGQLPNGKRQTREPPFLNG